MDMVRSWPCTSALIAARDFAIGCARHPSVACSHSSNDEAGSRQLSKSPGDIFFARVPTEQIAYLCPRKPLFVGVVDRTGSRSAMGSRASL
jgi:hypothetical protein